MNKTILTAVLSLLTIATFVGCASPIDDEPAEATENLAGGKSCRPWLFSMRLPVFSTETAIKSIDNEQTLGCTGNNDRYYQYTTTIAYRNGDPDQVYSIASLNYPKELQSEPKPEKYGKTESVIDALEGTPCVDEGLLKPTMDPTSKEKIRCQKIVALYTRACEDIATAKLESLTPAARYFTRIALRECKKKPPQNIATK